MSIFTVGKSLRDALFKNTTMISLELEGNKIDAYLDLIETFLSTNRDNGEKNPLIF
ncbi:8335_t:CDS:2 [Cetraspora pellucida]|uniref:8335_t:CDS:1 n=1 Tax=Cetraspora pellucida TaxID=1433469 RepID=A0A9N9HA30_9GLOM|nr:8335_t:CDS:2 [Cetraspora pellucida]